ncbi:hypothetical protein BKA67DRAFT_218700 [Truncatella angustata]|uniref:Uncharacterized protein n=1 Tax=Truncatella angustata TaxID=152316 RepID=A0A9P9A371_9PEZI|nr:uncharacterized protein BKA67DRAFT_218700 [Truncatella angustata]KAH6658640.1 hypothetical protein BKA67DRAFT_218700 [Truncatella angustata]
MGKSTTQLKRRKITRRNRQYRVTHENVYEVASRLKQNALVSESDKGKLVQFLTTLLRMTQFPYYAASNDQRIIKSFQVINNIVNDRTARFWRIRIAFWRLAQMDKDLMTRIQLERDNGTLGNRESQSNRTIATGIQGEASMLSTRQLLAHQRSARRWTNFSQNSLIPLLFAAPGRTEIIIF